MEFNDEFYKEKVGQELQSRMEWFKEALDNEKKREELHESIQGSEVIIRLEIYLPTDDPENFMDGLYLYINNSGEIVDADYYFRDSCNGAITRVEGDNLQVIKDLFQDAFSLEIE
ncbi:MAG: hypothetical protein QMD61_02580 [Methanobacterium sp.]|nr:hypothetical protein [Methanobacterium sp.]